MRARWEGLHAALVDSVMTWKMEQQFDRARRAITDLQRFSSMTSLLEFLENASSSLEKKDAIYRALVHAVQARASWAALATSVLWCGLWPGLDAVYRRQRRYFVQDPEELTSQISVVFTTLVGELDLQSVRRVAATLIRSTGREVARARQRQLVLAVRTEPLFREGSERECQGGALGGTHSADAFPEPADACAGLPGVSATSGSVLGIPVGLSTEAQAAAIHRWLRSAVGEDATLFLAVAVLGESPEEIAEQFGLSHVALRKRIQRIRTRLEKSLSQLAPEIGMSHVEALSKSSGPERR